MRWAAITRLCALAAGTPAASAGTIFLETFTAAESNFTNFGWILQDTGFIGVRFHVTEEIYIASATGNIGGSGSYFAAIDALAGPDAFPSAVPGLDPLSVLAYATAIGPGSTSVDLGFELDVILAPGDYAIFFGGIGTAFGWMPWASDLGNSSIPLDDYLEYYPGDEWFEFQNSGVRIVLTVETVPEPHSALLLISGLGLLAAARYRPPRAPDADRAPGRVGGWRGGP